MSQRNEKQNPYIKNGDPEAMNEVALVRGGDLGLRFVDGKKKFQVVQLDTGATSAAPTGVVAANQLAFWKDRATYMVTNNSAAAVDGLNALAGVFPYAATAGYFTCIHTRGRRSVATTGSPVAGGVIVGNTIGTTGQVGAVLTQGTALTSQKLGVAQGPASANVTPVYVMVDEVE